MKEKIKPLNVRYLTHNEFVSDYKLGKLTVFIDKSKAGDFVLSPFADKHNKLAHLFWSWLGIILMIPLPIALLFLTSWIHALGSFILGLTISTAARRSAAEFVLQNMLEDENFWIYVLLHNGAKIMDKNNNKILSTQAEILRKTEQILQ